MKYSEKYRHLPALLQSITIHFNSQIKKNILTFENILSKDHRENIHVK